VQVGLFGIEFEEAVKGVSVETRPVLTDDKLLDFKGVTSRRCSGVQPCGRSPSRRSRHLDEPRRRPRLINRTRRVPELEHGPGAIRSAQFVGALLVSALKFADQHVSLPGLVVESRYRVFGITQQKALSEPTRLSVRGVSIAEERTRFIREQRRQLPRANPRNFEGRSLNADLPRHELQSCRDRLRPW
jgi:hypothetical protein